MSVQSRMTLMLALCIFFFPFNTACSSVMMNEELNQEFGSPDFTLPINLSSIGKNAFEGASMTVVYISDGCTHIDNYAFKDCKQLAQIRIPAGCTIEETAFDGCSDIVIFGTINSPAYNFCSTHSQSGFTFVEENQPESSDIGGGSAEESQAPAGAVKAEVDAANSTVSVPNGVLMVKAESSKYPENSTARRFVYAMNEDDATHTSLDIINDILGLDGTDASFETQAFMLIDAKTFELIPAGKITVTVPGNQQTNGLTSEQLKCYCVGQESDQGGVEAVTPNANGTLTITFNDNGPFAICKLG